LFAVRGAQEAKMAFKVNYGLERAERNRQKQAKKEAKLQARKANAEQPLSENAPAEDSEPPAIPNEEQA
jgi:hypothetical protein